MTREMPSLLTTSEPRTFVPAKVTIGHIQLRDLLICPHEHGTVVYPYQKSIVEHDVTHLNTSPRRIADLPFVPNSLSTLVNPDTGETLLAAGGQEAELHLSLHGPPAPRLGGSSDDSQSQYFGKQKWKSDVALEGGASINNSVLLTSLSLTGSNESSVEPRVVISNNDKTVKFFDVAVRTTKYAAEGGTRRLNPSGQLLLEVPVNHSSISPDGRTLLSVGDSPDVYLHRITGGAHVRFSQMTKLSLSPYISSFPTYSYGLYSPYQSSPPVPASFSASFSANGSKFAVASQEGVVVVWDVRSTKPLKVVETDKNRTGTPSSRASGMATGWIYESGWDLSRAQSKAPGWGVRSVKFSPRGVGREVLTFTEHTSLMHIMDARTFETEEIVRIPYLDTPPISRSTTARPRSPSPILRHTASPSDLPLPPPPRIMMFSGALEDTFRIPSADSTGSNRRRRAARRLQNRDWSADEDGDGIVVIPPLGDREVDDDVRRLFQGRHALRAARASTGMLDDTDDVAARNVEDRGEDEMDVDELESDCLSSYNPSRASSPSPSSNTRATSVSQPPAQTPTQPAQSSSSSTSSVSRLDAARRASLLERRESTGPYIARRGSSQALRRNRRLADSADPEVEVDIAGTCFDPSGEYIYTASVRSISEWRVRGAEQTWWSDFAWA